MVRNVRRRHVPFAAIDCETDPFKRGRIPHPFAWGLQTEESFRCFWGVGREAEICDAIAALPKETLIYAHNGGRFDFHYFVPWFDPGESLMLIRGRIARCTIRGRELRDSWLLIPEALAATGQKSSIDYWKMEAGEREKYRDEITDYLRQDCLGLYQLIAAFHGEHGRLPLTLPSAALARWIELENEATAD